MRKVRMYDGCDYRIFFRGRLVYLYATPWYPAYLEFNYRKNGEYNTKIVWGWWR